MFDYLLLRLLNFRFLLKCLGLWKSTYVPAVVLADGEYKITKDELEAVGEDPGKMPRYFKIIRLYNFLYSIIEKNFRYIARPIYPQKLRSRQQSIESKYTVYTPQDFRSKKSHKFLSAFLSTVHKHRRYL